MPTLTLAGISGRISRSRKIAALVCLAAVLAVAGVQAMHMHAKSSLTQDGSLDPHCSLCLVSHCVVRPQQAYIIASPGRVLFRQRAAQVTQASHAPIFDWFVRPPPSV